MKRAEALDWLLLDTAWLFRQFIGKAFDGPNAIPSLTGGQHRIIRGLGWGPRSMSDVASIAGISNSSATAIVDRLVARGLVTKFQDAANRRRVLVMLSPKGKRLLRLLIDKGRAQARVLVSRLTEHEQAALERALRRLQDAMQETAEGRSSSQRPQTGTAA